SFKFIQVLLGAHPVASTIISGSFEQVHHLFESIEIVRLIRRTSSIEDMSENRGRVHCRSFCCRSYKCIISDISCELQVTLLPHIDQPLTPTTRRPPPFG